MERRTDSTSFPGKPGNECGPVNAFDGDKGAHPSIRRTSSGAIDVEYYERRARKLRARWMGLWFRWLIGHVARFGRGLKRRGGGFPM